MSLSTQGLLPFRKSRIAVWLSQTKILDFLKGSNPWVLRDMAERLLEASNRGLWTSATKDQLLHLQQLVISSEAQIERGSPIC